MHKQYNLTFDMKYSILFTFITLLFINCNNSVELPSSITNNNDELYKAISQAQPGDNIIMANGVWKDVQIKNDWSSGTKGKPITIKCRGHQAKSFFKGIPILQLGGDHIIVKGLYFVNGYSLSSFSDSLRCQKVKSLIIVS